MIYFLYQIFLELKIILGQQQESVDNMSNIIRNSGTVNNELSLQITKMNNGGNKNSMKESSTLVNEVFEKMQGFETDIRDVIDNVESMKNRLKELDPEWDSKFGLAEENVTKSLINIREANKTWNVHEININQQNEMFRIWNESFSLQSQKLRDKITKAKHVSQSVSCYLERSHKLLFK